jgi:hypothetical protein
MQTLSNIPLEILLVLFGMAFAALLSLGGFVPEAAAMLRKYYIWIAILCMAVMGITAALLIMKYLATWLIEQFPPLANNDLASNIVSLVLLLVISVILIYSASLSNKESIQFPQQNTSSKTDLELKKLLRDLIKEIRQDRETKSKGEGK